MTTFEAILRITIILFGIWAVVNSVAIGYQLLKKNEDED